MTQSQLNRMVKSLQQRLHLEDWTISARFASPAQMEDAAGKTWWSTEHRNVEIWLLPEDELKKYNHRLRTVLTHELLHVVLGGHAEIPSTYDPMYERGLNIIADLLTRKS